MIKKIIIGFIFLFMFFSNYNFSHGESLADKYKKNKGVVNIRLELKLEDENKKNLPISLRVVWKNEIRNKTYNIRYFNEKNKGFISMEKKLNINETNGYLYLYDQKKDGQDKILKAPIKIPLDYNFEGSTSTKIQLYYIQLKRSLDGYELNKIYTKYDLEQEEKEEEEKEVEIKGKVDTFYFKRGIKIGFYNDKGEELYSDFTNVDGEFFISLEDYKEKIKPNKDYYMIWGKDGSLELDEYGFLWEGKKYRFQSYKDLINLFENDIKIKPNLNDKDKAVKEDFPYLFLLFFLIIYGIITYYLFIKIIKKVFVKSLNRKQEIIFSKRKEKILKIKENLGKK